MTITAPQILSDTQITIAALSGLRRAAQLEAVARPVLRRLGLTVTDYHLLVCLVDLPGTACRPHELARRLAVTTGGVTRVVDRCMMAGWVKRLTVENDARGALIEMTEFGADKLAEAVPLLAAALRTHLEAPA